MLNHTSLIKIFNKRTLVVILIRTLVIKKNVWVQCKVFNIPPYISISFSKKFFPKNVIFFMPTQITEAEIFLYTTLFNIYMSEFTLHQYILLYIFSLAFHAIFILLSLNLTKEFFVRALYIYIYFRLRCFKRLAHSYSEKSWPMTISPKRNSAQWSFNPSNHYNVL